MDTLYSLWSKRDPEWETRYQQSVIEVFSDYGKGTTQYMDVRGKTFGAGYEMFILAFFIGLYHNQTKPLTDDRQKRKHFGQAIMYWGNIETRTGRTAYGDLRLYMFAALVARTDIDFIALDRGDITHRSVVDRLVERMEQYANWGFDYIREHIEDDPNHFFSETAFLRLFTSFVAKDNAPDTDDDLPEPLD